jgi:hypothetical protein
MSLVAAVALVLTAGTVALAAGRSGNSSSRRVAAAGANGSDSTTTSAPVDGTPVVGVDPASPTSTIVVPSTTIGSGSATTRPTTAPKVSTVPSTGPSTTSMSTTTIASTTLVPARSQVRGTVLFSPTCPVEQNPPSPSCAPRPGPAHIQLLRADGSVAAEGTAASDGTFAIAVGPGNYTVVAQTVAASSAIGRGCTANPGSVTVTPGSAQTVAVSCDTGIR